MNNDIRDLLYFLYDYNFFETYDIHNQSSMILAKPQPIDTSYDDSYD